MNGIVWESLPLLSHFFKRKATQNPEVGESSCVSASTKQLIHDEQHQSKMSKVEKEEVDISILEKDPGKRPPIWQYPVDQRDEIRISYLKSGPYQPSLSIQLRVKIILAAFKIIGLQNFLVGWNTHLKRMLHFVYHVICIVTILEEEIMEKMHLQKRGFELGERSMERIVLILAIWDPLLIHHSVNVQHCDDLMVKSQHIEKLFRQSEQIIANNRLQLETSVMVVRWLTFQGCPLTGNDERIDSSNKGNFIELIEFLASYSQDILTPFRMLLKMLNTFQLEFKKKSCIFLQEGYVLLFVKRLVILNFVL